MKILWLSHVVPYPPKAGVLLRAHYLIRELSKYHEIHLLAFNQRALMEPYFDSYSEGTAKAHEFLTKYCQQVKFVDCPVDRSPSAKMALAVRSLFSGKPYTMRWLESAEYSNLVNDWTKQHSYDLVHCDTISLAPYVDGLSNTLLSLDHHNVESHMLLRRADLERNLLKKIYFWQEGKRLQKVESKICPAFDTNITCSRLDTERFKSFCPGASFTEIRNGVDVSFFKPSSREPDPATFLFVGTLDWYPNSRAVQYIAERIWPLLKMKVPGVKINIIGANAPSQLRALSNNDRNFNVLGFVDDLAPFFAEATGYLCPITDGGGTKLKLLDAMAAGKAIVAHEVACEGLEVRHEEQLLVANSPQEYVESIQQLVTDSVFRRRLEKKARQHVVDRFAFTSIGKELAGHFEALIGKNI